MIVGESLWQVVFAGVVAATGSDAPLAIVHKRRDKDVPNQVSVHEVVGNVEGRVCVLVDDMIDTGGTICAAADALARR